MAPFHWSRWLRSLLRPSNPRPYRRPSRAPSVESLETRLAPATFTWTGQAGTSWANGANWIGGVAPSGSAATLDDLVFPASAPQKTSVNDLPLIGGVSPTFNSITISGSSYTLSGEAVTLGNTAVLGSGVITVGSLSTGVTIGFDLHLAGPSGDRQFFTVNGGADLTLNGHLSGATGAELAKEGTGTLVLAKDNSAFTGLITVDKNGGILRITNANALGDGSNGTVVQSNGQLQVQNVTGPINENLIINGPGPINDGALLNTGGSNTWAGTVALDSDATIGSNSGSLTITGVVSDLGAGHNLTKVGPGTIVFATDNTYRGETFINNGVLVIETPLGLGAGTLNSSSNDTIVNDNPNIGQFGQLQLLDPTGVGFTVLNEQLTLNDFGPDNNGALYNVEGNNDWAGDILLSSPSPNGFAPAIGAAAGTNLTIDGFISDGANSAAPSLDKVAPGRVILTNDNTYDGGTNVDAGALNIRDSNALGFGGVNVDVGAALELQVDSGFDPHGRNLGIDSVTGVANKLVLDNTLDIAGTGINNTGALHSISGINSWTNSITLGNFQTNTAAIGVEPDPNPSNSNLYFTNDYSLTVTGNIQGGNLIKDDNGQLILPNRNTYTGTTDIHQGWITIENNRSLGGYTGVSDPLEPATTVESGASLMLNPAPGANLNLIKNLVLSGDGITHPFGLISQKGALVSLGGDNIVGGTPNGTANAGVYSYIQLNGEAGIGVEPAFPLSNPTSSLTVSGVIADFPSGSPGSLTKFGSQRLTLEGEGDYTGSTTVAEGVLRAENNSALGQATSGTTTNGTETYTNTATTLGLGQDEIQSFAISGSAATFTLTFNGQTTPAFPYNVDPLTVQNALDALSSIGGVGGSVTVNQSGNFYTVTFGGAFQGFNLPQLTATGIGGTSVTPGTVQDGDSTALEMQNNLPVYDSVLNSNGLQVFNENLISNSHGNATFGDVPVAILGSDMMWRGNVTLLQDTTFNVPTGARLTITGSIDDAANLSPSGSALTLTGGGTLELDGANTYRGTTFVSNGTLVLGNSLALGGTGVSEVQTLKLSGSTTGTFTLSFGGSTTGPLSASSATLANDIENALNALPSVVNASGSFTVNAQSSTLFTVAFGGNFFGFNQAPLKAVGSGGASVAVGTMISGGGGTVVSDGSAVQLEGDLAVAGEPLQLQGDGRMVANSVPEQWFPVGPAPINNGPTSGNQAVTGRVTGVAVDFTNNNIVYVTTATGGVWKTINGGQTWTPIFDLQNGANEEQQIAVNGTGTFTLSFDGATTSTLNATSLTLASDIQAQLDALSTIGGVFGSVSVTQAGTGTFNVFFEGDLSQTPEALITATPAAGTTVKVTEIQTGIPANDGIPAQPGIPVQGLPMYIGTIAMDTNNPKILYIGTGEANNASDSYYGTGIYKSIDGGYHWTLVSDNEEQTVTVTGQAGTFNLTFNGQTTPNFTFNQDTVTVQNALNALSTIGGVGGNVVVAPTSATTIFQVNVAGAAGDAFTLSFGGQTTGNLDPGSATLGADIQTALMKLSNIVNAGGVRVTPTGGGGSFNVTFQTPGTTTALTDTIVSTANGPLTVTVAVQQHTYQIYFFGSLAGMNEPSITSQFAGGATTSQFITLLGNPFFGKEVSKIIVDDNGNNGNNGRTILYAADGDGSTGVNETQWIQFNNFVNGQTYSLTFTGPDINDNLVSDTTGALTFVAGNTAANTAANAAAIQAALQGLSNIGGIGGVVTVTFSPGNNGIGGYLVTFTGRLAQTDVDQLGAGVLLPLLASNESITTSTPVDGAAAVVVGAPGANPSDGSSAAAGVWRYSLVNINGISTDAWFNMTGVITANRYAVPTTNSVANANNAFASGSPNNDGTANPPNTPGPDDEYRAYFPGTQATWTDLALVYTDISNTNNGSQSPVLYAALGTASGAVPLNDSQTGFFGLTTDFIRTDTNNGVYWTENPSSTTTRTTWFVGDPGGSPFSDPAAPPTGVDARSGGEFPVGQFSIPNNPPGHPQSAIQQYGNIKISAVAGATLASTTVYAAVTNAQGGLFGIFKTSTGGQTWAQVTAPPNYMLNQGDYASSIVAVSATDVYVGSYGLAFPGLPGANTGIVFQTLNGGTSWGDVTVDARGNGPHVGVHALVSSGSQLYAATDGGLFRLESNGNWTDLNGDMTASQINSVAAFPNALGTIFATSQSNGLEEFTGGQGWALVDGVNGGGQVYVDPQNPNNLYYVELNIGTVATVRRSTDGGQTWTTILPTLSYDVPLVVDSINPARLLVGGTTEPGNLFPDLPSLSESFDGGNTWNDISAPISATALAISEFQGPFVADNRFPLVTDIGANTYDPNTIYVTDGTSIFVTKDGAKSWQEADNGIVGAGNIYKLVVDPRDRDTVYAIMNDQFGNQVFESTDAGQTWADISSNLPQLPAWSLAIDPRDGDVYIGLGEGVWLLPNGSSTWQQFGAGMPNVQVRSLQLNVTTNTLLAGTYGRGVYQIFLNDGSAGAGALQAVSGNSVWTGPVILEGSAAANDVTIAANGTQVLKNGLATATLNIIGPISDLDSSNPARLVKTGLGNVTLSGANTYNGVTEVREGYLIVNNPLALGSTSAGTVVDAGAALGLQSSVDAEPLTLNADGPAPPAGFNSHDTGALENLSNNNTYSGPITLDTNSTIGVDSGSSLNITGGIGGAFDLVKELTGTLILSGNNTYGGGGSFTIPTDPAGRTWAQGTLVAQGALTIDAPNGPGAAGNTTTVLDGAQLQLQGGVDVPGQNLRLSGTGINGTGALLNLSGANTWEGTITLAQDAGFLPATTPPATVAVGVQLTNPADSLDLTGMITQVVGAALGLTKVLPGLLILDSSTNNYLGLTNVAVGTLRVRQNGALGTTAVGTVVQTGAALEVDGGATGITVAGENLTLNGNGTPEVQQVTVSGTGGAFTLTFKGQTTPALAYNASAAQVRAALNALASIGPGGSGGVSAYGTTEVQQITVGGTSGTYTLSFRGATTNPIAFNATAAQVQTALNGLSTLVNVDGSVQVTQSGGVYTVTFGGTQSLGQQPLLVATTVTGSPNVTVSEVTQGITNYLVTFGGNLAGADQPQMTATGAGGAVPVVTTTMQGGAGALHNIAANNTWTGSVTLQSNTSVGADPGTSLALTGVVADPVPVPPLLAPVPAASLTKVGQGTVVLTNANTYTGLTFVNQGVLNIRNAGALGGVVSEQQQVTVTGSPTGSFTLTFEGQTTPILPANVPASGGGGSLDSLQNALNSLSTIGGVGGSVSVTKSGSIYTIKFGGTLAGQNLPQLQGSGVGNSTTLVITTIQDGSEPTTVASGATLQLQGGITFSNERLTINGPGFNNAGALENVSGNNTWNNRITLGSNSSIGVDSPTDALVVNQPIVDNGNAFGVTKVGPGILDYRAANTYTGLTTVDQGTLLLDDSTGASLAGNLTVGQGLAGNTAVARWLFSNEVPSTSTVTVLSDGLGDLNGTSQTLAVLNVNDGQVTTGASGAGLLTLGSLNMTGGTVTAATAGGSVILAGNVTGGVGGVPAIINGSGTLSLGGVTRTFNVNGPAFTAPAVADMVIEVPITGTGSEGIIKQGAGALELTNSNTYAGVTTVSQGALYVDGSVGTVSLNGGTLGGDGTVGTVTSTVLGGTLTGGDGPPVAPNTLNIQTTLGAPVATLNGVTKFNVELFAPGDGTNSQVVVSGPAGYSGPVMNINGAFLTGTPDPMVNIGQSFVILTTNNSAWTLSGKFTDQAGNPGFVFINGEKFAIAYEDLSGNPVGSVANPSTVNQVVLTRQLNTAKVAVSSSVNPSVYGQGFTVTATVTPEIGTGTLPTSDTVTFVVDNNAAETAVVNLGSGNRATFNPVAAFGPLVFGSHTITATFNADGHDISFITTASATLSQTVNQASVGITVSSSPLNPIPGQTVTVSATVAALPPGAGTPTGFVQFYLDGAKVGSPAMLDVNGVATTALPSMTASTHPVLAQYLGDMNFKAFLTPTAYNVVVTKGKPAVAITGTSSPAPAVHGQTVTLSVTLTGAVTPTGTVIFYDGSITQTHIINTATLTGSGGTATASIMTAGLTTGAHTINVVYSGDTSYLQVTTANPPPVGIATVTGALNFTIDQAATQTTLNLSAVPTGFGQPLKFSATVAAVAPGAGVPTGFVTFYDGDPALGGKVIGTPTALSAGVAVMTNSSLAIGSHTIFAKYGSDTNFATSTSTGVGETVLVASNVTVTSSPASSVFGQSVNFTAAVVALSPATGHPTSPDTVTFYDGNPLTTGVPLSGAITLDVNGKAVLSGVSTLSVTTHTIYAVFSGDSTYLPGTGTESFKVSPASTTTTVVAVPATSTFGQGIDFSATVNIVSPGAGTLTGSVTFYDGLPANKVVLGTSPISGNTASITAVTTLAGGSHTIYAVYGSDPNFAASTGTTAVKVNQDHSTTTLSYTTGGTPPAGSAFYSVPTTLTAAVTANFTGLPVPNGTVTFMDGARSLGTGTIKAGGLATLVVSNLAVGNHSLVATYAANTNFLTSASAATPLAVIADDTNTTVTSSAEPSIVGQSVIFTATVTPANGGTITPTGTVKFWDGPVGTGKLLGSAALTAGKAALATTGLLFGHGQTINAVYTATTTFNSSTGTATQDVVYNSGVVITTSKAGPVYGQDFTLTATVYDRTAGATGNFNGTVTFFDGGKQIGTPVTVVSGSPGNLITATLADSSLATPLGAGAHSITAKYTANPALSDFTNATSPAFAQTVAQDATTASITSPVGTPLLPLQTIYGTPLTFTATVTANLPGAGIPTGKVGFYDGATLVGTAPLDNTGTATFPDGTLGAGVTHSVTAKYLGDANFKLSAASNVVSVAVAQAQTLTTISATDGTPAGPANTAVFGEAVTFTATITAFTGGGVPVGTVTFSDLTTKATLGTTTKITMLTPTSGVATLVVSNLAVSVNPHEIAATFGNTPNYAGSSSAQPPAADWFVTVNKANTSVTVSSSANASVVGQPVSFTARVAAAAPGGGVPTGSVAFFVDGATTPFSTAVLNNGVAVSAAISSLSAGPHQVVAVYLPGADPHFNGGDNSATPFIQNVQAQTLAFLQGPGSLSNEPVGSFFTFGIMGLDSLRRRDYSAPGGVKVSVLSGPTGGVLTGKSGDPLNPLTFNFAGGLTTVDIALSKAGTYNLLIDAGNGITTTVTIVTQGRQT